MAPHKLISLLSNIKNNELTWNQHICSFLLDHGILGVSSSHPKFHKMEQNQDCIYITPLQIAKIIQNFYSFHSVRPKLHSNNSKLTIENT